MIFILVTLAFITLSCLFIIFVKKQFSVWKDMGAPYVEPKFPYGNVKGASVYEHDGQLVEKFYRKYKGKGPFVGIFFFLKPIAIITDLELVKNVLIKDFNNFHDRGVFHNEKDEPISAHLFSLPGLRWKQIRSKLSPTFTSGKMKMMFPTVVEVGKRLESKLHEVNRNGKAIDIKAIMARFTVDTIGSCAFGLDCNSLENDNSEFFNVGMSVFQNPRHGTAFQFLMLNFSDLARKLGMKFFHDDVSEFYTKIVRKTIDYRLTAKVQHNDFMDLLINLYQSDNENNLTFNEVLAQAFVFFIAGFETSATTLQFIFYELAKNPDIQEKVRTHISEVLARYNGEFTYDTMMDMKYLDQVINETLRLHTIIATLFRVVAEDYQVEGTKFFFKKGSSVLIPAHAIHMDPAYYPNPQKFNPENFSDENVKDRSSVAFIPFGEGPRICIGARFAMMQVKIGIIYTLKNCQLTLSPKTIEPLKLESRGFVTYVVDGVWLKTEPLDKLNNIVRENV